MFFYYLNILNSNLLSKYLYQGPKSGGFTPQGDHIVRFHLEYGPSFWSIIHYIQYQMWFLDVVYDLFSHKCNLLSKWLYRGPGMWCSAPWGNHIVSYHLGCGTSFWIIMPTSNVKCDLLDVSNVSKYPCTWEWVSDLVW